MTYDEHLIIHTHAPDKIVGLNCEGCKMTHAPWGPDLLFRYNGMELRMSQKDYGAKYLPAPTAEDVTLYDIGWASLRELHNAYVHHLAELEAKDAFLEWLIRMDLPGNQDRQTVTLTKIIDRARELRFPGTDGDIELTASGHLAVVDGEAEVLDVDVREVPFE